MTTDFLFFSSAPGADLLFGAQSLTTDATVEITGSFASLSAQVALDQSPTVTVAAQFPQLAGAVVIIKGREIAIGAQFLQLTGSMRIARNYDADVLGQFPKLTGSAFVVEVEVITIHGSFPVMVSAQVSYNPQVARPTVSQAHGAWQIGTATSNGVDIKAQEAAKMPVGWSAKIECGLPCVQWVDHRLPKVFVPARDNFDLWMQDGTDLVAVIVARTQEADRQVRLSDMSKFQDASPLRYSTMQRFQDGGHGSRAWRQVQYQEAMQHKGRMYTGSPKSGTAFSFARNTRFQEARVPPPGISKVVVPPPPTCYTPNPNLVFSDQWTGLGDLLFICDNYTPFPPGETVVVPVKRVYIVLNSVSLFRASDDEPVPVFSMSLSLDVDSWTWSFNASLPNVALNLVKPTNSEITELRAFVNGTEFRVLAESVSRSRAFGQTSISVSGRGVNASLDAPYAAAQSFGNIQERTAQQLMADVLTVNNIPLDWTINWELEDWIVPAGVFNHQGTYISALNTIAGAAGGFLLPHPSAKSFTVKHRYPVKPWNWATATPDFSLPASVVTQEGLEWVDKARYNRVYVAGQSVGVMGRITREGTAGDVLAQLVTDPLITEGVAARQRGIAILSDVGMQAHVTLRLPVLAETGVLRPGHMIDYVDGLVTRRGIVRSTQVAVQGSANVWQSIGVETHDV